MTLKGKNNYIKRTEGSTIAGTLQTAAHPHKPPLASKGTPLSMYLKKIISVLKIKKNLCIKC